ncbi:MAG: cyclic nucleotide-binding domain-containing protein [Candidatus Rokubacteria bacterium]|nr:cyclic nucleotide-binding domain-containing protein [Candidatus Rokubacteria bacterium]
MSSPVETAAFLRQIRLFKEIPQPDLEVLVRRLRERTLKRGQVLFREGDPGDEMFLVRRGTILVSTAVQARVDQVIARIEPGDVFGEMTLLDGEPRSATVQAETDAHLLVLDRENLDRLIELSPRTAAAFFRALAQVFILRLRRNTNLIAEITRWGLEATGLDFEGR